MDPNDSGGVADTQDNFGMDGYSSSDNEYGGTHHSAFDSDGGGAHFSWDTDRDGNYVEGSAHETLH